MSSLEAGTVGRTTAILATRTRDGSTPHAHQNAAISRGKGEGVGAETVPASGDDTITIVRASTRFEIRIRPDVEGLELLKRLDSVTSDVARARNAAVRANMLTDGAWLDAHPEMIQRWRAGEKGLEWWGDRRTRRNAEKNPNGVYSYPVMRAAAPALDPNVVASLQNNDDAEWIGSRFDVLVRAIKAPRFYKPNQPIRVPHRAVKLVGNEDGSADISLRLQASAVEGAQRYTFHLVPRDAWQREELASLASGAWKFGDAVLSRHPTKRGRWFVRLCYTRLVPKAEGDVTVVVRRGVRAFLVAAASSGECRAIYDGGEIIAFNNQMMARRRSLGMRTKAGTMGSGATGHGIKRRVDLLKKISDIEARYKTAACKRAARALVLFAQSVGAKEIVYEDFAAPKQEGVYWLVKRWPWYELGQACQTAAEAAGMPARTIIASTDRRRCPKCGHVHAEAPVGLSEGVKVWECAACGMRRSPDQVDALDMLRVVIGGDAVGRAEGKRKSVAKALASGKVLKKT